MPLQRGEILGFDFNRMVVEFIMFNQGTPVRCAISTAALATLKHTCDSEGRARTARGRLPAFRS